MDTVTDGQGSAEVAKPCEPGVLPSAFSLTAHLVLPISGPAVAA